MSNIQKIYIFDYLIISRDFMFNLNVIEISEVTENLEKKMN